MVYCESCGTQNDEDAEYCVKCGASLRVAPPKDMEKRDDGCFGPSRPEDECFGLPYGGAICGLIFGAFIILWGVSALLGFPIWNYIWFIVLVIFGLLVIAGSIYGIHRSRRI